MATAEALITENIDLWTGAIKRKSGVGRGGGKGKKIELYGVKKLRELILEMAVRGLLVPQDVSDEPASVLLEKLLIEKSEGIKKQKKILPITSDEYPFDLPSGWVFSRLGDIFDFEYGDNLPKLKRSETGEYPVYGSNGVVSSHNLFCVDKPCIIIGRKGSAGALNLCPTECWVTDVAYSVIPSEDLCLDFVFRHFHTLGLTDLGKGIKPGLNRNEAYKVIFSIPPLLEQHRIVAKVDELMALCDQLEQQTEANISAHQTLLETLLQAITRSDSSARSAESIELLFANFDSLFTTEDSIDQLKQTILQLAVMGKLVPQDSSDEPASVLLEKIAAEKEKLVKEKKIKKQKELPPIGDEEKPFELPVGWEWCHLPDVGELARGKSKHRPRNDPSLYSKGDIPLIQTGDVSRSNGVIETYTALYNEKGLAQSLLWPKGTMCITIAANIADTGTLGFDACFPDSVVGFTPINKRINVQYFEFFIRTAKNHLEKFAPSTAQKNINLEILGKLLVPCPPIEELERIVIRVNQLMSLCDGLKDQLNTAQTTQLHLADAVTEQAIA